MEMKVGLHYIVTKQSDDRSFLVGDHIKIAVNGDIMCEEAEGWMSSEYVADATKGMEYVLDEKWKHRKRLQLLKELQDLEQGE